MVENMLKKEFSSNIGFFQGYQAGTWRPCLEKK